MHHEDYELAENCWQQLREGRSKKLSADEVQQLVLDQLAPRLATVVALKPTHDIPRLFVD
jgi:hypothetical protein